MSREVILWNRYLHWGLSLLCGESCILECGVVYDGILMRSLLVSSLHSVFSSRNWSYMLILMGVLTLYQVWLWKLYLNFGKHSFGHDNMHVFSSSDIAKTFMLLCLKCYVDKEDNLMCYAYINVYALYCFESKSPSIVCSLKAFASQALY